jgi:hypothetical protein
MIGTQLKIGAQAQAQSQAKDYFIIFRIIHKDYFMTGQPKNKGPVYIIATTRVYITQLVSNFLTPN